MKRYQYWLAQVGSKSKKETSQSMLLAPADLPAGWETIDEGTWRTGFVGAAYDYDLRARHAGGFNALRTFKTMSPHKGLWVEVLPYASTPDAEAAASTILSKIMKNPKFEGAVTKVEPIPGPVIPGTASVYAKREVAAWPEGQRTTVYISGSVRNVVFIVACTDRDDGWAWDDIITTSALQVKKIEDLTSK